MISKIELNMMREIALGKNKVKDLSLINSLSYSQIYRILKSLEKKGILSLGRSKISLNNDIYIALLLQSLIKNPAIIEVLSDSGISILSMTLNGIKVYDISKSTGYKKAMIYKKLKLAMKLSIVKKEKDKYYFNPKLWHDLKEFLIEYNKYTSIIDKRIQIGSLIIYKKNNELLFESKKEHDASLTGFSVYSKYGISLLLPEKYYYLPKKNLSKKQIFLHSLYIYDKKRESRYFIYSCLFYVKFKKELKNINNPVLTIIKRVFNNEKISGYPDLKEIKEKAIQYDIRV